MESEHVIISEEEKGRSTEKDFGKKSGLQPIQDAVANKMHSIAEQVSETAQSPNVPTSLGSYGKEVSEFLDQGANYVRDLDYDELSAEVRKYVKENPGFSLLVAGAVGFLFGAMVRRM